MGKHRHALTLFALMICCVAPCAAQPASAPPAAAALPRIVLSAQSLQGLPRRTVATNDEQGKPATYSGVDLGVPIAAKGAPQGAALRGRALADYVVAVGSDGYRAAYGIAELDASFTGKIVLLADQKNGAPPAGDVGPSHVIIPDEKLHARWVRNVVEIDVLAAPPQAP